MGGAISTVGSGVGSVSGGVGTLAGIGLSSAFGKDYKPQTLSGQNYVGFLSSTGGAPLLTNIALGVNPEQAIASYFGKPTFQDVLNDASGGEQQALNSLLGQLKTIQSNTDLRNQAVQKVVQDFPNIVSMTAPKVIEAKKAAGEEFDSATKQYLDYAMEQTGAKYAAGGMISSGAQVAAQARNAAQLGMQRLDYTNQKGNQQLDLLGSDWQNQYNEANALRNFQQQMLGLGAQQGFSAQQNYLSRNAQTDMYNTGLENERRMNDYKSNQAMWQGIGSAIGQMGGSGMSQNQPMTSTPLNQGGQSGSYQNSAAYYGVNDRQYAPPNLRTPSTGGY